MTGMFGQLWLQQGHHGRWGPEKLSIFCILVMHWEIKRYLWKELRGWNSMDVNNLQNRIYPKYRELPYHKILVLSPGPIQLHRGFWVGLEALGWGGGYFQFATAAKENKKNSNNMERLTLQVDGPIIRRPYIWKNRGGGRGLITGIFFLLTGWWWA